MKLFNTISDLIASIKQSAIEKSLYGRMYSFGYDERKKNRFTIEEFINKDELKNVGPGTIKLAKTAYREGYFDAGIDIALKRVFDGEK